MEKNNILKDVKEYMEAKDAEVVRLRAQIKELERRIASLVRSLDVANKRLRLREAYEVVEFLERHAKKQGVAKLQFGCNE